MFWVVTLGRVEQTADQLPSPSARFAANPQLSGKDGGHTLNLHQFARDGVKLLGRLVEVDTGRLDEGRAASGDEGGELRRDECSRQVGVTGDDDLREWVCRYLRLSVSPLEAPWT
mgnify:CR=1 FL=1